MAVACSLDICKAAAYIRPDGDLPLRHIAYDMAHEVKVGWRPSFCMYSVGFMDCCCSFLVDTMEELHAKTLLGG